MKIVKIIRLLFHFVFVFSLRHGRVLFISFIAGFFIFLLLFQITPRLGQALNPNVKRIAIVGRVTPETLPIPIQRLISTGLTEVSENGEAKPALAYDFQIEDNGKTYIFNLKKGVNWHDGRQFLASDVNYNIRDVAFEAKDDHALIVRLKEPFIPLPLLLSRPLFRPGLVGLGPYKVTSIKLKGDLVEALRLDPLTDDLPHLLLRFFLTEEAATLSFKLGEVDILEDLTNKIFDNWPNVEIEHRIDYTRYVALFYNLKDPLLSDKTVRQALSFAVPQLESEVAIGPISPLSWAYNNKVKVYKFDLEAANRLLKKDLIATSSGKLSISTFAPYLPLARQIASSWQKLPFEVDVKLENSVPDDFQILLASQNIPPDPDQYALWHSTQKTTNITGFANAKVDKLLEDGRVEYDKQTRLKIYADFQKHLAEEVPVTFLFYPSVYTVKRK